jgi:hypothetical protein
MGFLTIWDGVIHLNSSLFKRNAKKSASGTEIECNVLKAVINTKGA